MAKRRPEAGEGRPERLDDQGNRSLSGVEGGAAISNRGSTMRDLKYDWDDLDEQERWALGAEHWALETVD